MNNFMVSKDVPKTLDKEGFEALEWGTLEGVSALPINLGEGVWRIQGGNLWYADMVRRESIAGHPIVSLEQLGKISKLLAAAPMLYEALEGLMSDFESKLLRREDGVLFKGYNAAKTALAAAK